MQWSHFRQSMASSQMCHAVSTNQTKSDHTIRLEQNILVKKCQLPLAWSSTWSPHDMTAYCSHRILSKSKILASARQRLLWINLVVNISFLLTTPETGGFEPMTPGTETNKIHKIFFNKIRTIAFLEKWVLSICHRNSNNAMLQRKNIILKPKHTTA